MKFIGIVSPGPAMLDTLLQEFRFQENDVLEISVGGRKLRFAFCRYREGFPLENFLRTAEDRRREIKGSGVVCVAGVSDMERLTSAAVDMGYRVFIFDLDGDFLYGRGLFPVIRVRNYRQLIRKMEEIL